MKFCVEVDTVDESAFKPIRQDLVRLDVLQLRDSFPSTPNTSTYLTTSRQLSDYEV